MSNPRPGKPAGPYVAEPNPTPQRRQELIAEIERFPVRMRATIVNDVANVPVMDSRV
jgi:hypothetical protein